MFLQQIFHLTALHLLPQFHSSTYSYIHEIYIFSFQHSQNALTVLESMEPGDKVLIPCPKRKKNIRFEGKQNEKLVLRAEVLEASEFSITVRFLDYGAVQEYNPDTTDIYFPDQEFFDDKTYPMFAIRYGKMLFKGK